MSFSAFSAFSLVINKWFSKFEKLISNYYNMLSDLWRLGLLKYNKHFAELLKRFLGINSVGFLKVGLFLSFF